jgi:type I restriction enzyme, S subunit
VSASLLWSESLRLVRNSSDIRRLRSFVLDQAIQGKLVRQNPDDEPADVWLKRTAGVRQSSAERRPVPRGWMTVRLSDISRLVTSGSRGWAQYYSDDGALFVRSQNVREGYLGLVDRAYVIPPDGGEGTRTRVQVGDLLVVITGDVGHVGLWVQDLGEAYVSQHLALVRPLAEDIGPWLLTALLAPQCGQAQLRGGIYGGKPGLNLTQVRQLEVPIPPLSEQCRIVAKVDELIDLCDELEVAQTRRDETRDRLRATSLARLTASAETPGKVDRKAATFFLSYSGRMVNKITDVPDVRRAILDLAASGRLVAQNPFERLDAGLRELLLSGDPDSLPSKPLPDGWSWATIAQMFDVCGGIQKQPMRAPRSNAYPYLGVSNVQRGYLDLSKIAQFELYEGELERYRLQPGDLLVVEGNGSPREIGRCAEWLGQIEDCVHQNHIIRCRPRVSGIGPFALLYLNSPAGTATMRRLAITSAGLYSLSVGKIRAITVPVPPLPEQARILAKVRELLTVCDQLEASLAAAETGRVRLLDAVLAKALEGTRAEELVEAVAT